MDKISLVLCTLNNTKEIKDFIKSLDGNLTCQIELIVVDQNVDSILYLFNGIDELVDLKYHHVNFKGLSRARNFAIKHVTGDIISFPDDDCVYSHNLISSVQSVFKNNDIDFLSVNTRDPHYPHLSLVKLPVFRHSITYQHRNCVSFTLFFRRRVINLVGNFDEKMGVGSGTKYGAGEESDYVVRALSLGFVGLFFPDLYVFHPAKESLPVFNSIIKSRMLSYGGGYGYFVRKNFKLQGSMLSFKNLLGVLFRLLSSLHSYSEFRKSFYFSVGFINGFFKQ